MRLLHRRHYTSATEYVNGSPHTLRTVLGMIDLDLVAQVVDEDAGIASRRREQGEGKGGVKRRGPLGEETFSTRYCTTGTVTYLL